MKKEQLIAFWIESADRDTKTMEHLFEKKDYNWTLFIGHLVLEKLLKAFYVKDRDVHPPLIHNLLRLAEKTSLPLDETQKDMLVTVTTFNLRARYDDYKSEFYHTCTREFTQHWLNEIKGFITWRKTKHLQQ